MLVIIGFVIIFGGVSLGFAMAAGGHGGGLNWGAIGGLFHTSEFISLGGMVFGSMIVMSPVKVLKGVIAQGLGTLKGSPSTRQTMRSSFNVCTSSSNLAAAAA